MQCHQDQDCNDSDKCVGGTCIEACLTTQCGLNAQCVATGICQCASGFTGNPYIECGKRKFRICFQPIES